MIGRPYKSFERINRIFPECLAKLDTEQLSDAEKREREQFIMFCLRVCEIIAAQRTPDKGGAQ